MHFKIMPKLPFLLGCSRTRLSIWLQLSFHGVQEKGLGQCYLKDSPPAIKIWLRIKSLQCLCIVTPLPATQQFWASQWSAEMPAQALSRVLWHHKPQAPDILKLAVWTPSINNVWACCASGSNRHSCICQVLLSSWVSPGELPCPHTQNACSKAVSSHQAALSEPSQTSRGSNKTGGSSSECNRAHTWYLRLKSTAEGKCLQHSHSWSRCERGAGACDGTAGVCWWHEMCGICHLLALAGSAASN